MSRSSKKGPYVDQKLLDKVIKQKDTGDSSPVKTWARNSQVSPEMVNHTIAIHDGKKHVNVYISEMMIGHYLGEFVPTRTFRSHGKVTKRTADKT
jgi:small subunit ribosomal protein S19